MTDWSKITSRGNSKIALLLAAGADGLGLVRTTIVIVATLTKFYRQKEI
ncbi:hypothetical protein [Candidatus Nitrotoga sp. AM1P]|nr:hypothetical protein [Candidatus Nitrotoga sp. AM1P]